MTARQAHGVGQTFLSARNWPAPDCQAESSAIPSSSSPLTITRRRLPHWKQDGSIYGIAFRLAGAIPQDKFETCKPERDVWLRLHPQPCSETHRKEYDQSFGKRIEPGSMPAWDAEPWRGPMCVKPSRDACCDSTATNCYCTRPRGEPTAGHRRSLLARRILRSRRPQRKAVSVLCPLYC